jgi:Zn-finger nucleic acid-binding protein
MHNIPPFDPAILEFLPDGLVRYENIADYALNATTAISANNPYFYCRHCEGVFFSRDAADAVICKVLRYRYNFALRDIEPHFEVATRHNFITRAAVYTELGDRVTEAEISAQRALHRTPRLSYWARYRSSFNNPDERRLLPLEREQNAYYRPYKHYPSHVLFGGMYRSIKTTQARRHAAGAAADPEVPNFRAKRNATNLPSLWDDKVIHRDKSWKRKKVKKQWMVKLS